MAVPSAHAIVGGEEDTEHDYVVFLGQQILLPNGQVINGNACSGTLVAPTVVVTAAHCSLVPPPFQGLPQRWVVRQGESIMAPTAQTTGRMVTHPDFCQGCAGGPPGFPANNDLAVVLLDAPLPGPYANLPKEDWVGKHFEKSKQLLVVGYGTTETSRPPAPPVGLGTRRAVQSRGYVLAGAENFLELPTPDKDKYGFACSGDSGGGNFVGDTLVGVSSIGDTQFCDGPNYVFRIDTPSARAFLGQFVELR